MERENRSSIPSRLWQQISRFAFLVPIAASMASCEAGMGVAKGEIDPIIVLGAASLTFCASLEYIKNLRRSQQPRQ